MFKLTVEPENPKKISPEEYKRYLAALDTLRNFEKQKEALKEFSDVQHTMGQLKNFVKQYRTELRLATLRYKLSYKPKKKSWAALISEINHSFNRNVFYSSSIIKNKKHEMYHRALFKPDTLKRAVLIQQAKEQIRSKITEKKTAVKAVRTRQRAHRLSNRDLKVTYQTCGGVVHKVVRRVYERGQSPKGRKEKGMGVFMRFLKSSEKQIVFSEKNPTTSDNYIGIEIEFICDLNKEDLAFALYEAGIHKSVCLKTDGSIKGYVRDQHPHELCILAKEKDVYSLIEKVCEVLADTNAQVNKTCGLHVHLDMRNRNSEMAFNNLVCSQNILYAMNPFSRQSGTYCRRVDTKDFDLAKKGTKYFGINAESFNRHKTIEIRIHSGTIQSRKISNWVKLLLQIVNRKEMVKKASSSLKEFINKYEIDIELAKYISERMNKFTGDENKNVEEKGAA